METQISAGLARAETDVRDHALHHAHECETRLQEALKQSEMQFETAAKVHAELQSTHIEGRLRATREADIQQYMLACDTNIQNTLDEARSDMEARASVYAEVQCESVEERLQQKLNRALRAAEEESHTYVDTRATEITTKFERALYDAKTEIDTACEIRAASTEARLQKMLWEAQDGTQAKLSDMEVLLRDGVHHTKPNHDIRQPPESDQQHSRATRMVIVKVSVEIATVEDSTSPVETHVQIPTGVFSCIIAFLPVAQQIEFNEQKDVIREKSANLIKFTLQVRRRSLLDLVDSEVYSLAQLRSIHCLYGPDAEFIDTFIWMTTKLAIHNFPIATSTMLALRDDDIRGRPVKAMRRRLLQSLSLEEPECLGW
ncbi:hypothetical protein BBJ28_00022106 [Nothophytophthora sp. Chile5]|nr:hypothetical protein BBJ28_00022106 [Nothophytophthora sp. Chile5]